jgi:uncharacterized membrane protein
VNKKEIIAAVVAALLLCLFLSSLAYAQVQFRQDAPSYVPWELES